MSKAVDIFSGILFVKTRHYDDVKKVVVLQGNKPERRFFEEQPQGEWIPVSERLPDEKLFNPTGSDFGFDFEEVLCTTIWGVVRAYKFGTPIGHYRPHFWLGDGIMDEYVIAWKPLPEPYKEEGESDADS